MKSILLLMGILAFLGLVSAFPSSINVNIQFTQPDGTPIPSQSFLVNFSISPDSSCSTSYFQTSTTLTGDSRGVVNYTITGITGVNWNDTQYYFCYWRGNVLKSSNPMSVVPYSFYSNNSACWQGHCDNNGSWLTGTGNSSWNQSYANTLYANITWNYNQSEGFNSNLTNGFSQDVNPLTNIIQSLGSSIKRWLKGWFKDIDYTGTLTGNMGNITNISYVRLNEVSGACDLTKNHSLCSNVTGTYLVG